MSKARRLIRISLQTIVTNGTVDTETEKAVEISKGVGDVSGVKDESEHKSTVTATVTRETSSSTQALPTGVNGDDGDIER